MWLLLVTVWTLENGQMQEHSFRSNDMYQTQAECVAHGQSAANEFIRRVPGVAGTGFLCGEVTRARPGTPT